MQKMNKISFNPQKVFLTGANGFLGKGILRSLQQENIPVTCYARRPFSNDNTLADINLVTGELNEIDKMRQALSGCDSIIHCAGMVDFSYSNYEQLRFVHVEALKNLITASKGLGIKRLIYVSSHWSIGFSLSKDTVCSEECLRSPDNRIYNAYQKTKLEGEDLLNKAGILDMDYVIVNPTQIWGPENTNKNFRPFIEKAKTKRFFVVPCGGINIVHVDDASMGTLLALKHGRPGERYILGGENVSFKSLASKFLQIREEKGFVIELFCLPTRFMAKLVHRIFKILSPWLLEKFHFLNSLVAYKYYTSDKARRELSYNQTKCIDGIIRDTLQERA